MVVANFVLALGKPVSLSSESMIIKLILGILSAAKDDSCVSWSTWFDFRFIWAFENENLKFMVSAASLVM